MEANRRLIHNRAEGKALGIGLLRGLIVCGICYIVIRVGFTLSGTAELVPASVNSIVMIIYGIYFVAARGLLNLRDYQLRIDRQAGQAS